MWIEILKLLFVCHPAILPYYVAFTSGLPVSSDQLLFPRNATVLEKVDRTGNAVWLEHRWLQDGVQDQEIVDLANALKQNGIRYVFPHLAPATASGGLPEFSATAARRFVKILRREAPEVRILPWVGGVQKGYRQSHVGTVDLDSEQYLNRFTDSCTNLAQAFHLDGIHLNVEPVVSGDPRFVSWLHAMKQKLGDGILSVAAVKPVFFEGLNLSPLHAWDISYLEAVGRECDQLAIMNYDTGIPSPLVYGLYTRTKTISLLERFEEDGLTCKVLLGIPTYDDTRMHQSAAENIPAAVNGLLSALSAGHTKNFEGAAIYAFWTTDAAEWDDFSKTWLRQR